MPKFILSPQHPVGFHRFSDCFFIFRLSGRIQSPYLFRLNVRDLLQLRRIRFRAVLCFSRAALLICSESDTSLNNYIRDWFLSIASMISASNVRLFCWDSIVRTSVIRLSVFRAFPSLYPCITLFVSAPRILWLPPASSSLCWM